MVSSVLEFLEWALLTLAWSLFVSFILALLDARSGGHRGYQVRDTELESRREERQRHGDG